MWTVQLQLLLVCCSGAAIAKAGLHGHQYIGCGQPHARDVPIQAILATELHAVIPRAAHDRGAPNARKIFGSRRRACVVLLLAIGSMRTASAVHRRPRARARYVCDLARCTECSHRKGPSPVHRVSLTAADPVPSRLLAAQPAVAALPYRPRAVRVAWRSRL